MKLSENTLSVLKSFAKINQGIVINEGSTLRSWKNNKEIFAEAEIDENFEGQICIGDLNQFLSIVGELGLDSDIKFGDTQVAIEGSQSSVVLRYAKPELIQHKNESPKMPDASVKFSMTREQMETCKKFTSILRVQYLTFIGSKEDTGHISIVVQNPETPENKYDIEVECEQNDIGDFEVVVDAQNLLFIPAAYDVSISKKGLLNFAIADGTQIQYWVVADANYSDFGGE